ncbi:MULTISPECIES: SDR family oxidoreductase [unclassified Crossiella]|uniref:SDR family NAD(P)-dependent oxidoreductase n=1 Tax=unclassified Crossiella TaxID=2620835 RepID=UPI001FFF4214|nr:MULTISPECIES: SDR family oxidoreductase [unclassified Crossiella]MCK2238488.1 SDR family oxidoreductase [Crossiella sp. S99.2]MCK2251942.1 SDR family oxidoreductase [Crossiella sp. S99.1]
MRISGKHIVVTGAASPLGAALVHRFARAEARAVVAADFDLAGARAVAAAAGPVVTAHRFDAGHESEVLALINGAVRRNGDIDVYCANPGLTGPPGGAEVADDIWDTLWRAHVLSPVWAARALVPRMRLTGGYLVLAASAAGLLTQPSALVHTVVQHAAVALAEWLNLNHAKDNVRVSCVCPSSPADPERVAETVITGMADERLLILPHPEVQDHLMRRASDHETWLNHIRDLVGTA